MIVHIHKVAANAAPAAALRNSCMLFLLCLTFAGLVHTHHQEPAALRTDGMLAAGT